MARKTDASIDDKPGFFCLTGFYIESNIKPLNNYSTYKHSCHHRSDTHLLQEFKNKISKNVTYDLNFRFRWTVKNFLAVSSHITQIIMAMCILRRLINN
jgi:hypothetical protein